MVTDQNYKVFENRMRRMARRQGLTVMKSRRRDPMAWDYGGFMIVNDRNYIEAGENYAMSLEDVEKYLKDDA